MLEVLYILLMLQKITYNCMGVNSMASGLTFFQQYQYILLPADIFYFLKL